VLQDHHALIPLAPLPAECDEREGNVYRLILEQFFTALMPPYIYNAVSIEVEIARHLWAGSGSEVVQQGWKAGRKSDDEDPEENYAGLAEGESYPVNSVAGAEKRAGPQKHYTCATLLSLMEPPAVRRKDRKGNTLRGRVRRRPGAAY